MRGHTDITFSVDFNPSGDAIATGSEDQSVRFWKTQLDSSEAQGPIDDLIEKARKQLPTNPGK
jgi:WD40 repeat protein